MSKKQPTEEKKLNIKAKEFRPKEWNLDAEVFCPKLNSRAKKFISKFEEVFKKGTLKHSCFPAPKGNERFIKTFSKVFRGGKFQYYVFRDDKRTTTRTVFDLARNPDQILCMRATFSNGKWKVITSSRKDPFPVDKMDQILSMKDKSSSEIAQRLAKVKGEIPDSNLVNIMDGMVEAKKEEERILKTGKLNIPSDISVALSQIRKSVEKSDVNGTRVQAFYCEDDPSLTYVVVIQPVEKEATFTLWLEKAERKIDIDNEKE